MVGILCLCWPRGNNGAVVTLMTLGMLYGMYVHTDTMSYLQTNAGFSPQGLSAIPGNLTLRFVVCEVVLRGLSLNL